MNTNVYFVVLLLVSLSHVKPEAMTDFENMKKGCKDFKECPSNCSEAMEPDCKCIHLNDCTDILNCTKSGLESLPCIQSKYGRIEKRFRNFPIVKLLKTANLDRWQKTMSSSEFIDNIESLLQELHSRGSR